MSDIWRVSGRRGFKLLEDDWYHPKYEEVNTGEWHTQGYVHRSDMTLDEDAVAIIIGMCGLRTDIRFNKRESTADSVIFALGTRGCEYRLERLADASEVTW